MTNNLNNLLNLLPLELRTPRKGDQPIVTNPKAQAFWIGHILGDGSLRKDKGHLAIDQASENLSKWFHSILDASDLDLMLPDQSNVQLVKRLDKRRGTITISYRFTTRAYKVNLWYDTFYEVRPGKKVKKKVPDNIGDLLVDPFSLAIWFLGDGWFDGDNVCFAAGDLTEEECKLLQACLLNNFGLKTSLVKLDPLKNNGRTVHRITLSAQTYPEFYALVQPFLQQLEQQAGSLQNDPFLKRKVLPKPSKQA
jgi:LAGLIDADG DNA endonuclease family